MKTIPLRQLLREPLKVKRWTRVGQQVQVTDSGKPLWIIHPAVSPDDEELRVQVIDELLSETMTEERLSKTQLSQIIQDSRR